MANPSVMSGKVLHAEGALTRFRKEHEWLQQVRFLYDFDNPYSELEDVQFLASGAFWISIPPGAPIELKNRVFAAVKSYQMGIKSLDYFIRSYGTPWDFKTPQSDRRKYASWLDKGKLMLGRTLITFNQTTEKPSNPGNVMAAAALLRLLATFKARGILIKRGLAIESLALSRVILEQIGWAYAVRLSDDPAHRSFNPRASMKALKSLYPDIGPLYHFLGDRVHVDFPVLAQTVDFDSDGLIVTPATTNDTSIAVEAYLALVDAYCAVSESLLEGRLEKPMFLVFAPSGECRLRKRRPSLTLFRQYEKQLARWNTASGTVGKAG